LGVRADAAAVPHRLAWARGPSRWFSRGWHSGQGRQTGTSFACEARVARFPRDVEAHVVRQPSDCTGGSAIARPAAGPRSRPSAVGRRGCGSGGCYRNTVPAQQRAIARVRVGVRPAAPSAPRRVRSATGSFGQRSDEDSTDARATGAAGRLTALACRPSARASSPSSAAGSNCPWPNAPARRARRRRSHADRAARRWRAAGRHGIR